MLPKSARSANVSFSGWATPTSAYGKPVATYGSPPAAGRVAAHASRTSVAAAARTGAGRWVIGVFVVGGWRRQRRPDRAGRTLEKRGGYPHCSGLRGLGFTRSG